jgi:DNA-binding transcriptional regulator of glucitol operon
VLRRYRFTLRPGWLLLHLIVIAMVVAMILLGRWQLHVSESKHFSVQNFGYSLQWWAFSAFAAVMWWRLIRDAVRRDAPATATQENASNPTHAPEPVAYRRYVMPTSQPTADDPVRAAYNDYLAGLAADDARAKNRR